MSRKPYPSDVSDAEWEFLIPYLTLMRADAPQREYALRDVFDAVRYVVKTGCQWDFLPHDFPPWTAVYQQARRWIAAGVFEEITHDLRMILRLVDEREAQPTAAILDARTLQSTPGERRPGRLRRGQEEERLEGPHGRGHAGSPAGVDGDGRQHLIPHEKTESVGEPARGLRTEWWVRIRGQPRRPARPGVRRLPVGPVCYPNCCAYSKVHRGTLCAQGIVVPCGPSAAAAGVPG